MQRVLTSGVRGLLLLLAISLAAAGQVTPDQTSSGATYSLIGTVQNSVTGEPIAHALVQIATGSQPNTFTDSGGRFEFDGLLPGSTSINARKPGFLSSEEADMTVVSGTRVYRDYSPAGLVRIGPDAAPVTLQLIPEGVIFGRAQKPDGEPIGNLTVQVFNLHIADGRKRWDLLNNSMTNEEGEFRVAGLRPGRYYLAAGPRYQSTWIGAPGKRAQEAAYRPIFYPGVSDVTAAAPIDVAAGQQVEADLALSPDPVFRVSGSVLGLPADTNADEVWPRLQIISRTNNMIAMPVGAESGNEFRAKVPAGSYLLRADVDTPTGSYRGEVPINVQSDISGVNLVVAPAPPIRVDVNVQRMRASSGPGRQLDQVILRFLNQEMKLPSTESTGTATAGAVNTINGIDPGVYAVEVSATNESLYVDSAQCGGTDLLRDNLTVGQGPTPPIRVSLRDDGGKLIGTVLADGHRTPATVLMIPDRTPKDIKTAQAGPDGQFESPRLAPGDYSVLAFDRVTGLEYTNPEAMSSYSSNATRVSVVANSDSKISVNLIRTAK